MDIRTWLEANRNDMIAFLGELVAIASENPPGNRYDECVDRIQRQLDALGIESDRIGPSLVGRTDADRVLVFHGHYDVVPAQDPSQFQPRIEKGTMFGRGTTDMKGGVVAMIYAARALAALRSPVARNILLTIVPDEETGGQRGSATLLRDRLPHAQIAGMLLPEPTSGVVWNGNRGAITLEVTIRGREAHVGLAHQGINAFEQMVAVVNELLVLKREIGSILLIGGTAQAGTNFNVVPATARFTIDRRIDPGEDFETERNRVLAILERARANGVDLEIATIQEGLASESPADGEVARALSASIANVKGKTASVEMCPGLLETRFYAAHGVPAFAYGPGVLAVAHGPNEFVKLDEVVNCAAIYAETALRVFGVR